MSISGINQGVYSAYSYQWKQQQLQGTVANSNSGNTNANSGAYAYNGMSTVASMVELAQYAMDAMGVGKNERVTFSQIQKYKNDLEQEFSAALKKEMQSLSIAANASYNVTVDADGKILVSSDHPDKDKIQKYFDNNPTVGKELREGLTAAGVDASKTVQFNVDSNGNAKPISAAQNTLQGYFDKNEAFGSDLMKAFEKAEIKVSKPITMSTDEFGTLTVDPNHPEAETIQKYIDENPEVAQELKKIMDKQGFAEGTTCSLTIDLKGKVSAEVHVEAEQADLIKNYLTKNSVGSEFRKGLDKVGIDPKIDFRLTLDENGKVKVISSHPDADKVQKLLDGSESLTKKYKQIDALAGLDAARKSMQIDPTAMRKRIEIESMSAWWGSTGTSSIGSFTGGNLSTMAGLNSIV